MRLEMKRAAESVQRPPLMTWPIRSKRLKVNTGYGSFASRSSRRNRCITSRLMSGNGGRPLTLFRRNAQFAHRAYSGCCLESLEYRFFAQSECFRITPRPMTKSATPPGPGNGLVSGAATTKIQPNITIIQR